MVRTAREGNIEMLRCILMFLIVFGHCCCHGPYAGHKDVLVAGLLTTFAVNAFAFISGYYSIKTSASKILRLVASGLFAALVVFCYSGRFALHMGWYGNAYMVLLLLAPYLNAGMDFILERKGVKHLLMVSMLYVLAMVILWLPLGKIGILLTPPGWSSYSAYLLIGMYIIGRIVRLTNLGERIESKWLWCAFCFFEILVLGWSGLGRLFPNSLFAAVKLWLNMSPVLILQGVVVFFLFRKIQIPLWLERVFIFCAPSMFVVYLLHDGAGRIEFSGLYGNIQSVMVQSMGASRLLSIFVSASIVFVMCILIDFVRRGMCYCASRFIEGFQRSNDR